MLLYSLHELTNSQVRAHQTIATHMRNTLNLSITKRIAPVGVAREWGWRGGVEAPQLVPTLYQ